MLFTVCLLAGSIAVAAVAGQEDGVIQIGAQITLAHTLFRPDDDLAHPVVLVRTPYGRKALVAVSKAMVDQGFVVMLQDCRGTGTSTGAWTPFVNETEDGKSTLEWIRRQPWCNGRVGMAGASYLGIAQWQLAPSAGDQLSALVLELTSSDLYRDVVHLGGVQSLAVGMSWAAITARVIGVPKFRHLPLIDADNATGADVSYWNEWTEHYTLDEYWAPLDMRGRYAEVKAPALLIAGWYDLFLPGQMNDYMELAAREGPPERSFTRLIVGPWDHVGSASTNGRPDLGAQAYIPTLDEQAAFLARFLKGEDNGYESKAGVRAFFLGDNEWRELDHWPPKQAVLAKYYLHSDGAAAAGSGGGVLTRDAPKSTEPADHYRYDPLDPTPSYAKDLWMPLSTLQNQTEIGKRKDVLSYATLPLSEDLTIAGPVRCTLYISSDAPDTDFAVKLVDLDANGKGDWRGEGILRARVRDSVYDEKLLEPGKTVALTIPVGHMACTFKKGHRVSVQITSSNFPRFARNLNTEEPSGQAKDPRVANQSVWHDVERPSLLELFVLAQ